MGIYPVQSAAYIINIRLKTPRTVEILRRHMNAVRRQQKELEFDRFINQ